MFNLYASRECRKYNDYNLMNYDQVIDAMLMSLVQILISFESDQISTHFS